MTTGFKQGVTYLALKRQAEEKVLLVSPPYGSEEAQRAFLSGYETALSDIAHGRLTLPNEDR